MNTKKHWKKRCEAVCKCGGRMNAFAGRWVCEFDYDLQQKLRIDWEPREHDN